MRVSPSFLDEIRSRVPISSVIGKRVQWDRRKTSPQRGDFWACCPFHVEKTPSFHADDRKGRYHCFGCKQSGDIFTFLVEMEALFFEAQLQAARGAKARGYLADRGVPASVQQAFRLGFAPDDRQALRAHLAEKHVTLEQMIEAGLVISGDDVPVAYDRFRDRVMFPIRDARGRVIALGGR